MENILKGSHPIMTSQNDRQDESLTGQVHDQAGHCPLTGRYFEPCCASPIINRICIMPGFTLNLPEKSSLPKFCHAQQTIIHLSRLFRLTKA